MNKQTKNKIFQIQYGETIEAIKYYGTCLVGGIIGFVIVFALMDLFLMLNNQI